MTLDEAHAIADEVTARVEDLPEVDRAEVDIEPEGHDEPSRRPAAARRWQHGRRWAFHLFPKLFCKQYVLLQEAFGLFEIIDDGLTLAEAVTFALVYLVLMRNALFAQGCHNR